MENIFESSSELKQDLRKIYYDLLKSKKGVTYEMVFESYISFSLKKKMEMSGSFNQKEYESLLLEKHKDFEKLGYAMDSSVYNTMKKIIPSFNKYLDQLGYPIVATNVKGISFTLVSEYSDHLQQEEKEAEYKKNVKLFSDKIQHRRPVLVKYKPFNKEEQTIIFHPHVLRNYMGKWYVLGISESEGHSPKKFDMAINRIITVSSLSQSVKYIEPLPNQYDYLRDIIGVYKENKNKTKIILKAIDENTHGKLVANPLHSSQEIVADDDFGYIELNVIPNGELRAIILSYGTKLKVLEPQSFKNEIKREIMEMLKSYEI